MSVRLGVNVDHVATLRQVRGGTTSYPDLLENVNAAIRGGADQITVHLREDRRHIQPADVLLLTRHCSVDLNLEMAATENMLKVALKYKPRFVCLVPEKRQELTTEGGLDVARYQPKIAKIISALKKKGIETSLFVAPDLKQIAASKAVGGFAVELHTGHWVLMKGAKRQREWKRLVLAAERSVELGLKVHAGHGLDYDSTREIMALPHLRELNIGHSIVCHALLIGMEDSVRRMKVATQ